MPVSAQSTSFPRHELKLSKPIRVAVAAMVIAGPPRIMAPAFLAGTVASRIAGIGALARHRLCLQALHR